MKHLLSTLLLAALTAVLLPFSAVAQNDVQLVDVVATGHGTTPREAAKAALRAAVDQVVGSMVDATTLVENDDLVEDRILTFSAGLIADSKIIGTPKKDAQENHAPFSRRLEKLTTMDNLTEEIVGWTVPSASLLAPFPPTSSRTPGNWKSRSVT